MTKQLKETDTKNHINYYFDIININDFNPNNIKVDKNCRKIFSFTTLDIKHQIV